jgi:peptide subunit release factor 1 (eRF1)
VAEAAERRTELEEIDSLLEAASTRHVVLGADDTLEALGDGRIHALFIADPFVGMGAECPSCGLLVAHGAQCPRCEAPLTMVRDLRERIAERALDQGARVEVVSGKASARLLERGGIGAWTRY